MPRTRDVARYGEEYWDLLDAVSEGKVVELPFVDEKAAKSFQMRFYAFTIGIAAALQRNCKGLEERLAERVRRHAGDYGMTAVIAVKGGLKFMSKSMTPEAQMIQAAIRRSAMQEVRAEVTEELAQASAEAMMRRLTEKGVVGEEGEEGELPPLGRPNPYY